jgi:hypothetical protein
MLSIENKMMIKQKVYLLTYYDRYNPKGKTEHAIIYSEAKMLRVKSSYLGQNVCNWNIQEIEIPTFPDIIKQVPF